MAHQSATDNTEDAPTVYDREISVHEDPYAEEWWSDELNHRLNLRIPEWMFDELEQHADYQQQEVSELAREVLEYALMEISFNEWSGINNYGRHTYGDVKCPSCAETNGLKLRWRKQREGFTMVGCRDCGAEFSVEEGRKARQLHIELQEVWYTYAFRDKTEKEGDELIPDFNQFIEDPKEFVESVKWSGELPEGEERVGPIDHTANEKRKVYSQMAEWEKKHTDTLSEEERVKNYVNLEAGEHEQNIVETVEEVDSIEHDGRLLILYDVQCGDEEFWVLGGETAMNLYTKKKWRSKEEAVEAHTNVEDAMSLKWSEKGE